MNTGIEFYVERSIHKQCFSIYARAKQGGQLLAAQPLEFKPVPNDCIFDPFGEIDETAAQQLMDELWRSGLRPTEGMGSAGSLAATQEHLKDMRTIAFSFLDKSYFNDKPR